MKQGDNVRNYHAQLYKVLQLFTSAWPQLTNVSLPIRPNGMMQVFVIMCILFVIQDMQEGDMLCGCYGTHGSGIQCHSRACNVYHTNLDNPGVKFSYLVATQVASIARNHNLALCKRWSHHRLNNVFDYVPMADPVRGIYGAALIETMHGDLLDSRQRSKKQIGSAGCSCNSVSQVAPSHDSTNVSGHQF